jgi:xylulokinase
MMGRPPYFLGIDIGGTGAKAGIFDLDGNIAGQGYHEYRMVSNVPGQAEHDAESWWLAAASAVRNALKTVPAADVAAVGVSCTNGLIAVDKDAKPLRSAIMLWDQRALPEVARIKEILDPEDVFEVTGNPVAPGAYSLPTILWLKHHDPLTFNRAHKLMVPGGYLVARLTGRFTIDFSRACTTLLFDIRKMCWHQPFLEALEIPAEKLPETLPSSEIAGNISTEAAALTGLKEGIPVTVGCMDTIAASIGAGIMDPGACFVIMGTAARVSGPLGTSRFDHRFMNCTHVVPERWQYIGAINGVGSSLRWVRDTFGHIERRVGQNTGTDPYDLLTAQAATAPPGSKGLLFLPYISGERTPVWNPFARGVFFGVTLGHNRGDFIRSVLEGSAFAIRHVIQILESNLKLSIRNLRIGGAAAASIVWNQIIADVTGKEVSCLKELHIEVLGAALLAAVSSGAYKDYTIAVEHTIRPARTFTPDSSAHAAYDKLFPLYLSLYPEVSHHFKELAEMELPKGWIK